MKKSALSFAGIVIVTLVSAVPMLGQWSFDFENGVALAGYNDVQIPRDAGTLFSLSEDLAIDPAYYVRFRLGYRWKDRLTLSIFAAPFRLRGAGTADRQIDFNGDTFGPGVPLTGVYKFNSYRLSYRYDLVRRGRWRIGLGLTAFVRDAAIKLEGGGQSSTKSNVGFVPLLNFSVLWQFAKDWAVLFEGDAAAAKQGRAEDVLLALQFRLSDRLALRAGYRILEGGADVEEVYNFALVHYLGAGVTYVF
jgi:hypothetical protein